MQRRIREAIDVLELDEETSEKFKVLAEKGNYRDAAAKLGMKESTLRSLALQYRQLFIASEGFVTRWRNNQRTLGRKKRFFVE